jgi:dipeptidyl aminopeptidase/acylaminoacyl peptidase
MEAFMRRFLLCLYLSIFALPAFAGEGARATHNPQTSTVAKRPFTFEDMMKLRRLGEFDVSPDGKWVAFSATTVDLAANTRQSHLYVVPIAGGRETQITKGNGEMRPKFSPDGKSLAYITEDQIYVAGFDANGQLASNPKKVTTISTGASGAMWSPDGQNIVFTSEVWPDCNDDACNKQKDDDRKMSKVKAQIWTHLLFRHWSAYGTGKRTHVFVGPAAGGEAKDLTPGDHDAPPFSLGGQDMYAVSPDGKELAFTSNIDEVPANSTNNEIFIVPMTGGTPKKISTSPGSDSTPLYSPDGKYIAWRMQVRPGYESDKFRLVIYERATGKITNLTENFDRWVGSIAWAADSKTIYFSAEDEGGSPIYSIGLAGGQPNMYWVGSNGDIAVINSGRSLVLSHVSVTAPAELFRLELPAKPDCGSGVKVKDLDGYMRTINNARFCGPSNATRLTRLNDSVLDSIQMQRLETFWFNGAEDHPVQGFVVKPPNFDASKKYPVKFLIHGGPQGAWGDSWSYRWNPELFAANGYVVVMINPRGSTGYGQKFIDDINGDWGGRVMEDLNKGLDYAEKTYPFIDKTRECALGASYGGYAAYWLEGHSTRFKCIVSHDGMFNTVSAFGTTEELWFPTWEFKGTPWSNPQGYNKWSPHLAAPNFKTPILIVHGQLDYRLDVSEGFQAFTTMQFLKVPSKMLYFPDEGHWVLKPQNSQLWYKTVNDWVDQWTK